MRELIAKAMRKARPTMTIKHAHGPADALREAVRITDGGPVLFVYEKHAAAQAALDAIGATAWLEVDGGGEPVRDQLIGNLTRELAVDA